MKIINNSKMKKEIKKKLELDNVTNVCDEKIEYIAMQYPEMYNNEQEFIEFQEEIANLI